VSSRQALRQAGYLEAMLIQHLVSHGNMGRSLEKCRSAARRDWLLDASLWSLWLHIYNRCNDLEWEGRTEWCV
jgi:hypothetical protein